MAAELRWILSGFSALLLLGIWWWGVRRSRRSSGNPQLRESSTGLDDVGHAEYAEVHRGSRDWGVPPFEPLSVRTADFDQEVLMDLPMSATAEPLDVSLEMHDVSPMTEAPSMADPLILERQPTISEVALSKPATADPAMDDPTLADPAVANATTSTPNASETQKIVTVRVCAIGDAPWPGTHLLAALESHGMGYGRYKVFHRKHASGRTLFCAASLVEPGTFDLARMPQEEFRGLTLFAVLPGPEDALDTVDTLIGTAMDLADALQGVVQDSSGAPLSAQRAVALREDVARFQSSLS